MGAFTHSLFVRFPILTLTLLQFSGGKAVRFVVFFAFLPVIFGIIDQLSSSTDTARLALNDGIREIIIPTILPIATLILATTAIGDEIEDRTMVYLVLKPISRLRIVIEKYLAVAEITVVALWVGLVAAWLVTTGSEASDSVDVLVAAAIAILFGVLAYGALFLFISLFVPRALMVGIIYTLIWESLLSRLIPGARVLSVRFYVQSIYTRIVDDPAIDLENAFQLYSAAIVLVVLIVISIYLASLRLRSMDFE